MITEVVVRKILQPKSLQVETRLQQLRKEKHHQNRLMSQFMSRWTEIQMRILHQLRLKTK